jgi:hypothetical protein
MSTSLERPLRRCGMKFMKAGPSVEYHGLRTPYYAACEDLEKELFNRRRDLFDFFFPAFADALAHTVSTTLSMENLNARALEAVL